MKKSFYFWSIALLFLLGTAVASALVIYGVMPNTDDDVNQEYLDIYNSSCETIDLMGISIVDASGKKYTFTGGMLESGNHRKVYRSESKITLNNADETLQIFDAHGAELYQIHYATSVKNTPIEWPVWLPNCQVIVTEEIVTESLPEDLSLNDETWLSESPIITVIPPEVVSDVLPTPISTEIIPPLQSETESITDSWSMIPSGIISGTGSDAITPQNEIVTITPDILIMSESTGTVLTTTPLVAPDIIATALTSTGWTWIETPSLSWTISPENIGAPLVDTSILIPQQLFLHDTDNNQKIDCLEVQYSGALSWAILPEKFILFSASGWLADQTIETGSGIIKQLSYSGTHLIIEIFEQNLSNLNLKINTSTASHIRLKSLSGFWLTNHSGIPVLPLTFTQSFDGYNASLVHNMAIAEVPAVNLSIVPSVANSSQGVDISPSSSQNLTSVSQITSTIRLLPEPTILFQSGITPQGFCTGKSCRINVIHPIREKFEMCRWQITPELGRESIVDGCNPGAVALGGSGGTISLTLLDSAGILPFKFNSFQVKPYPSGTSNPKKEDIPSVQSVVKKSSPKFSESTESRKKQTGTMVSTGSVTTPKTVAKKAIPKSSQTKNTTPKKTVAKKVTTTTTTKSNSSNPTKEPKASIVPLPPKTSSPSDSVTLWIIGIACAGIGFCIALLRRRDVESKG